MIKPAPTSLTADSESPAPIAERESSESDRAYEIPNKTTITPTPIADRISPAGLEKELINGNKIADATAIASSAYRTYNPISNIISRLFYKLVLYKKINQGNGSIFHAVHKTVNF